MLPPPLLRMTSYSEAGFKPVLNLVSIIHAETQGKLDRYSFLARFRKAASNTCSINWTYGAAKKSSNNKWVIKS